MLNMMSSGMNLWKKKPMNVIIQMLNMMSSCINLLKEPMNQTWLWPMPQLNSDFILDPNLELGLNLKLNQDQASTSDLNLDQATTTTSIQIRTQT